MPEPRCEKPDCDNAAGYRALNPERIPTFVFADGERRSPDPTRRAASSDEGAGLQSHIEYLRTFIAGIRKKIEENASDPKYVLTHARLGYRFARPGELCPSYPKERVVARRYKGNSQIIGYFQQFGGGRLWLRDLRSEPPHHASCAEVVVLRIADVRKLLARISRAFRT